MTEINEISEVERMWRGSLSEEELTTLELMQPHLPFCQQKILISRIRALRLETAEETKQKLADMFYYDIHHSCMDAFQVGEIISGKSNIL